MKLKRPRWGYGQRVRMNAFGLAANPGATSTTGTVVTRRLDKDSVKWGMVRVKRDGITRAETWPDTAWEATA